MFQGHKSVEADWQKGSVTVSMEVMVACLAFTACIVLYFIGNQCGAFGGSKKKSKKSRA